MSIKKIAGQTLWYGVPNILGKFLSYLSNLIMVWLYLPKDIATITQVYTLIPFLTILYTYGLETSYFRFIKDYKPQKLFNLLQTCIIASTLLFSIILFLLAPSMALFSKVKDHPEFFYWLVWVLFFDTLIAIPYAKLRHDERPKKYAFAKLSNVVLHLILFTFFIFIAPKWYASNPDSVLLFWYNPTIGNGYYIIANIIASIFTFGILWKEITSYRPYIHFGMLKKILKYSLPLVLVGLGGMVNELLSRVGYVRFATGSEQQLRHELGVFGGNYRLVVLITIFIQAYRMAVEPFFFKKSGDTDAKKTYARLMKMYVIASCIMYLFVVLFLDFWKLIITAKHPEYGEAISIVPILSAGAVFLGIYYNQSVWYKLSDKNNMGAIITLVGAFITILLCYLLIPIYKYNGAAWANVACYVFMMVTSYILGQKYYPIHYPLKKIYFYLFATLACYGLHSLFGLWIQNVPMRVLFGVILLIGFTLLVLKIDKKEFENLPIVGKFVKKF